MDLGIDGKWAVVCASSKGLGFGCAKALALEGVNVVINSRSSETLAIAADEIQSIAPVKVISVVGDVTTEEGRIELLNHCESPDILVTNAGGPPPGIWSEWNREDFIRAIDANMLAPVSLIQSVLPSMMDQGWGRIVNITSQSVKAPIAVLGLSNSARAGLTGFVAGTARQVAGTGVTINNLLPGIHATDRAVALDTGVANAQEISIEEAKLRRCKEIPVGRYGTVDEFGAACAFLCSQYSGFIVGQNILLDGGGVNATL